MKRKILYLFTMLVALMSCDNAQHEQPAGDTVVTVGLNTENVPDGPFNNVHLYWFDDTDKLFLHGYYPSMKELALARIVLPEGSYTAVAVLNTDADFNVPSKAEGLPDISLADFNKYVREQKENYEDMLTGTLSCVIKKGEQLLYIDLKEKGDVEEELDVKLLLNIPSADLPDFTPVRSTTAPALRATAFVFKKGVTEIFAVKRAMLASTENADVYSADVSLPKGEYDINLWVDYAVDAKTDNHYMTTDPDVISLVDKAVYRGSDDTRKAFSKRISLTVDGNAPQAVDMYCPLAKYKLVATDVEKYEALRVQKGYPALDALKVVISYEGYLPTAYSITEAKLADSEEGYSFSASILEQSAAKALVATDYVLVNQEQSSVTVTILFKDASDKTIGGVRGVKIAYRAGQLTTVSGNFLTAGMGQGITVDTDWSGDHDVDFPTHN